MLAVMTSRQKMAIMAYDAQNEKIHACPAAGEVMRFKKKYQRYNCGHKSSTQTGNPDVEDKLTTRGIKVIAVIRWESSTGIPNLSSMGLDDLEIMLVEDNIHQHIHSIKTITRPGPQIQPDPRTQLGPSHEAETSCTPTGATKRKRCDDYEAMFLQNYTRVQEENATNARATTEQLKVLSEAFTKITDAIHTLTTVAHENKQSCERMAAPNETMAAAIVKLAESIAKSKV
uniref:Uncharacterized protein n=1 Tax=Timema poppense TaxID=170557 RepID=A0A7R9GYU3_TIMPO|nr:unnamed protein product [Timema poppensis]